MKPRKTKKKLTKRQKLNRILKLFEDKRVLLVKDIPKEWLAGITLEDTDKAGLAFNLIEPTKPSKSAP